MNTALLLVFEIVVSCCLTNVVVIVHAHQKWQLRTVRIVSFKELNGILNFFQASQVTVHICTRSSKKKINAGQETHVIERKAKILRQQSCVWFDYFASKDVKTYGRKLQHYLLTHLWYLDLHLKRHYDN